MQSIINNASSSIQQAYGIGYSDAIIYMKLLLLDVLGSALGILALLLQYIIALAVISAIVIVVYQSFRLFEN